MADREGPIHKAIVRYLRLALPKGELIHHAKNEGNRGGSLGARDGARAKAMGTCPGWPDIEFTYQGSMCFIEVKTPTGRLTAAQKGVLGTLGAKGFPHAVCRSVTDAEAFLGQIRSARVVRDHGSVQIEHRGSIS